jgi:hypothetical protein
MMGHIEMVKSTSHISGDMMDFGIAESIDALVRGGTTFVTNFFQVEAASTDNRTRTATDLAIKEHGFDLLFREKEEIKIKESILV